MSHFGMGLVPRKSCVIYTVQAVLGNTKGSGSCRSSRVGGGGYRGCASFITGYGSLNGMQYCVYPG